MEDAKNTNPEAETENDELDDVVPVYANNVRFEMTAWDLRMLFGQLMPSSEGKGLVDWHTDVTIPWAQAKLMHLYLGINLSLYERENGKITVPPAVLPAAMTAPPPGIDISNPEAMETFERVQSIIKAFRATELSAGDVLSTRREDSFARMIPPNRLAARRPDYVYCATPSSYRAIETHCVFPSTFRTVQNS